MRDSYVLVVGDKFAQFAAGKDAMTISQLKGLLALPQILRMGTTRVTLIPGQGLSDADLDDVCELARNSACSAEFDLSIWRAHPRRAPKWQSHKHAPKNTLISSPRRLNEDEFELDILIDENCELMGDHQTGQHLQGMLLVEAARQSFLAVSEAFFLPQDGTKFYFVINEMSVRYNRFAFPLDARIRYVVREKNVDNPLRQSFTADIIVEQCGMEAASLRTVFTAFEDSRISSREGKLASDALQGHLGALAARLAAGTAEAEAA